MSGFFAFLLFLSLLSIPIGLIKPSLFNKLFKKDMTRKKLTIIFVITSFVLFFAFGSTVDSTVDIQDNKTIDVQDDKIALKENNEPTDTQKEPNEEEKNTVVNEESEETNNTNEEENTVLNNKSEESNTNTDDNDITPPPTQVEEPIIDPAPQTTRESALVILKENAKQEWGEDYSMVQYEYEGQVEAYDWVMAKTEYPDIMNKAKQEWGNDYKMVKYEYEGQVEAYEWIEAQTEYPNIMSNAKQEWGDDYKMVKYEYNKQVEAYDNL